MKYIKYFESTIEDKPKIGEYIISYDDFWNGDIDLFLRTHIGKIIEYPIDNGEDTGYTIEYKNVPVKIAEYFVNPKPGVFTRYCDEKSMILRAKTKKELLLKIQANKYNI